MNRRRVLCISDSVALPRPGVSYEDTWIARLGDNLPEFDFIPIFRRSTTTDMLAGGGDYGDFLLFYTPEQVIIQLGICDCSPRYIRTTSLLYKLVQRLPNNLKTIFWSTYKTFIKRSAKRTDVSIERFSQNIRSYLDKCIEANVQRVIIIKIATPGSTMIASNPLVVKNVNSYNSIYEKIGSEYDFAEVINPLSVSDDSNYVDGYHPCDKGNALVSTALLELYK